LQLACQVNVVAAEETGGGELHVDSFRENECLGPCAVRLLCRSPMNAMW
jgi:hypothetical protein